MSKTKREKKYMKGLLKNSPLISLQYSKSMIKFRYKIRKKELLIMDFDKITAALGFELHEWQKKYIEDKYPLWDIPPKSGKTTAYMIKLLTNETTDIPFGDLKFLTDADYRDEEYYKWFVKSLIKLKTVLDNSGIETRRIVK